MTFNPRVSIIIPVYNGADYLAEAIDSALAQTYKNVEILVINDGSTDNGATEKVALSYGDKIRYIPKVNGGVASALNTGIDKMEGEYFSWLSHDDRYYPNKVECQINHLKKVGNSEVVVFSDYDFIDANSKVTSTCYLTHIHPGKFRYHITVDNKINGCSLLIPKVCFDKCGVFDLELLTSQDYDLWFKIGEKYTFVHQPEVLISSRKHQGQTTYRLQKRMKQECNDLFLRFVKELSDEEFVLGEKLPQSLIFAKVAAIFALKGFYGPVIYLSKKALSKFDLGTIFSLIVISISFIALPTIGDIRRFYVYKLLKD